MRELHSIGQNVRSRSTRNPRTAFRLVRSKSEGDPDLPPSAFHRALHCRRVSNVRNATDAFFHSVRPPFRQLVERGIVFRFERDHEGRARDEALTDRSFVLIQRSDLSFDGRRIRLKERYDRRSSSIERDPYACSIDRRRPLHLASETEPKFTRTIERRG